MTELQQRNDHSIEVIFRVAVFCFWAAMVATGCELAYYAAHWMWLNVGDFLGELF
jgi:hypothetical protein